MREQKPNRRLGITQHSNSPYFPDLQLDLFLLCSYIPYSDNVYPASLAIVLICLLSSMLSVKCHKQLQTFSMLWLFHIVFFVNNISMSTESVFGPQYEPHISKIGLLIEGILAFIVVASTPSISFLGIASSFRHILTPLTSISQVLTLAFFLSLLLK